MTEEDRAELLAEAVEQSCRLVKHMGELLEIVIRERDQYKDMLEALQATFRDGK